MALLARTVQDLEARGLPTKCERGRVTEFLVPAGVLRKMYFWAGRGECIASTLISEVEEFRIRSTRPVDAESVVVAGGYEAAPEACARLAIKLHDDGTKGTPRAQSIEAVG